MNYTSAAGPASALPKAKAFVDEYKKKFGKNPEPYAAEAYDATTIAIKAIEAATEGGKAPTARTPSTAAVRKVKLSGITGDIEFDGKGDRQGAPYFVLQVASDNPEKWGENKIVKQLAIAPPPPRSSAGLEGGRSGVAPTPAPASFATGTPMDFELLSASSRRSCSTASPWASCTP